MGHTRQAKGYQPYWGEVWDTIASMVKKHEVTFIGGDFNMALFAAKGQLAVRSVTSTFLGSYAWRHTSETTHVPQQGFAGVRFDSMGLFAVGAVTSVSRWITPEITPPPGVEFTTFEKGQGYVAKSYGGENAVRAAFASPVLGCVAGHEETSVVIKQKLLSFHLFVEDTDGTPKSLLGKGAHMPLLFYWGSKSRRSAEAIAKRQLGDVNRGWGPERQRAAAEQRQREAAGIHGAGAKGGGKAAGGGKASGQPSQSDWHSRGGWRSREKAWPGKGRGGRW